MQRQRRVVTVLVMTMIILFFFSSFQGLRTLFPTQAAESAASSAVTGGNVTALTQPATSIPDAGAASELSAIIARGKLVVAMYSQDRPPFFYKDEQGRLVGSDVVLAQDMAKQLGVTVEFDRSAQSFDEVVNIVAQGKADIAVSKLSVTLPRALKVRFTEPYIVLKQALIINRTQLALTKRENQDIIQVVNKLHSRIGIMSGTSYVGFAKQLFPDAELVTYTDMETMMRDVAEGNLLAVLYDENEIKKYIFEKPERSIDLKISILEEKEDLIAIAVAPQNTQLLYWMNLYLKLNKVNMSIDKLLKDYNQLRRPS